MGVDVSGEVNASGATVATPASSAARAPTAGIAATTTMVKPVSIARANGGRAASAHGGAAQQGNLRHGR